MRNAQKNLEKSVNYVSRWLLALASLSAAITAENANGQNISAASLSDPLRAKLSSQGYSSLVGSYAVIGIDECERFVPVFGSCYGNNPASPYLIPTAPYWSDEFVDPFYGQVPTVDNENFGTRRQRADEALVVLGRTGPTAAYTGIQSYLFTRQGQPGGTFFARLIGALAPESLTKFLFEVSPNPDRFTAFASLGDSVNNAVIAKSVGQTSGFDQEIAFVSTADRDLADQIRLDLISLGLPKNRIFVEQIPNNVKLGYQASADDLVTLIRYALPKDAVKGEAYRHSNPFSVLKVRKTTPKLLTRRFGDPVMTAKQGNDESQLETSLNDLTSYARSVFQVAADAEQIALFPTNLIKLSGPDCIKNQINCLGDSQDTDSYRAIPAVELGLRDVMIVTGVNHNETGNATYVSLAVSKSEILQGIASVSQTGAGAGFVAGELKGSVDDFLAQTNLPKSDGLIANKGKLYIHLFARDCTGLPSCTTISVDDLPLDQRVGLVQRAYLRPGNTVGADPEVMLSPNVVIWKR